MGAPLRLGPGRLGRPEFSLLIRRSISRLSELAFYLCHTPRPAPLADNDTALPNSANEIRHVLTTLCAPRPDEQHVRR
jgi:hypothetical protein